MLFVTIAVYTRLSYIRRSVSAGLFFSFFFYSSPFSHALIVDNEVAAPVPSQFIFSGFVSLFFPLSLLYLPLSLYGPAIQQFWGLFIFMGFVFIKSFLPVYIRVWVQYFCLQAFNLLASFTFPQRRIFSYILKPFLIELTIFCFSRLTKSNNVNRNVNRRGLKEGENQWMRLYQSGTTWNLFR